MMKIITSLLALVVLLTVSSCDIDDDNTNFHYETLEITEATLPETFEYGELYTIEFTFLRPTDCHFYEGFDFEKTEKTERTIYAIGGVLDEKDCKDLTENNTETRTFDFEVRYRDPYTFKFYQGKNEEGEDQYITVEVPVGEPSDTIAQQKSKTIKTSQYY